MTNESISEIGDRWLRIFGLPLGIVGSNISWVNIIVNGRNWIDSIIYFACVSLIFFSWNGGRD